MGHRAQERAYRPKEAWGSHPPPRHQLYAGAAMNQRYKEARRAVSKGAETRKPHFSAACQRVGRVQPAAPAAKTEWRVALRFIRPTGYFVYLISPQFDLEDQ